MHQSTVTQDLVLVGGGHSHAIALKLLGMHPVDGTRVTLISPLSHTPYSGMLPGHVAGFYDFDECHIDLRPLSGFAKAQFIRDRAVGLDLENRRVLCANHPPIGFDILSLDIGSTPAAIEIPGANEYAIRAKPVDRFLQQWNRIIEQVREDPQNPWDLGIVGGGAGGVELALTVQAKLHQVLRNAGQPTHNLTIHLFHRGSELLSGHGSWVSRRMEGVLRDRGIQIYLNENVTELKPGVTACCESGLQVACDRVFWVTQASSPDWIAQSGLTADDRGFILVSDTLQSVSHPFIFAAGDIATMQNHPRPKAGVFAVRQGKPLFQNLQRQLRRQPLQPYRPQRQLLALIGTGDGRAIASRGALGFGPSKLLWWWKDRIDRKFMERLSNFSTMEDNSEGTQPMYCAGCASKVGSSVLERVLQRIDIEPGGDEIQIGLNAPDDAAVVRVTGEKAIVHTIDFFRSFLSDPYIFGQITANHCLNDLFAMGATPQTALAMATVPHGREAKAEETLYQLLSGAVEVLQQANATLVGGHTNEGDELALGLSCNGTADPDRLLRKSGMQPGQVLILTKPLGTGTLFAADMRLQAKGRWIEAAVESMLRSNQAAADCLRRRGASACTDVTGFGLAGHLVEMVKASGVGAVLDLEAIPVLEGAIATAERGILSSLHGQNLGAASAIRNFARMSDRSAYPIVFDPQTSGGLLAAIPPGNAGGCIAELQKLGYPHARAIGYGTVLEKEVPPIVLKG